MPTTAVRGMMGQRPFSPAEIASLEQLVAVNPEDANARMRLLSFYASDFRYAGQDYGAARLNLIRSTVDRLPASTLAGSPLCYIGATGRFASTSDHAGLVSLWLSQAYAQFEHSEVVLNALRFLAVENKSEAEELFARAVAAHPTDLAVVSRFGLFYAAGLTGTDSFGGRVLVQLPDSARTSWTEHCRSALDGNSNPYVLMGASIALPNMAMQRTGGGPGYEAWVRYSEDLRKRAGVIDPDVGGGRTMPVAFGMYAAESQRFTNEPVAAQPERGQVRVSKDSDTARLISSPDPVYPQEAVRQRIQGTVRMEITIGPDGRVSAIQLISGHPLLVPAAVEAVRNRKYKLLRLDGVPSSAHTTVEVPFVLPASGNLL